MTTGTKRRLAPRHAPPRPHRAERSDLRAELRLYFGVATDAELRDIAHRVLAALGDAGPEAVAA